MCLISIIFPLQATILPLMCRKKCNIKKDGRIRRRCMMSEFSRHKGLKLLEEMFPEIKYCGALNGCVCRDYVIGGIFVLMWTCTIHQPTEVNLPLFKARVAFVSTLLLKHTTSMNKSKGKVSFFIGDDRQRDHNGETWWVSRKTAGCVPVSFGSKLGLGHSLKPWVYIVIRVGAYPSKMFAHVPVEFTCLWGRIWWSHHRTN